MPVEFASNAGRRRIAMRKVLVISALILGIASQPARVWPQSLDQPDTLKEQAPAKYRVRFDTTKGTFVVEVTRSWAPLGADRFYNLVKNGFYTDASFFRVIPDMVAQFGISANPQLSMVWREAKIADDPVIRSNEHGTLSFATFGKDARTTQVFINLRDNTELDRKRFPPFGKVVEGMKVVDKLYAGYGDEPPRGRGPSQTRIINEGKAYLDQEFPKLDSIKSATIEPE
jgi:peptidyl-prolyl cis-trans isomerase A (cyclophilin A)